MTARQPSGEDLVNVRVVVDGVDWLPRLDGLTRSLDPGHHRFRFETPGYPAVEREILLLEGEKMRAIDVRFERAPLQSTQLSQTSPERTRSVQAPGSDATLKGTSPSRVGSGEIRPWIFGGVGTAALIGFGVLGGAALEDLSSLRNGCGRTGTCSQSDVDSIRMRLWIADGLLGVAVAAVAVGGCLWLVRDRRDAAVRLSVRPDSRGSLVELRGRF